MRALSQLEITQSDYLDTETTGTLMAWGQGSASVASRVNVYRGSECILENKFKKSHLCIGRSLKSEIVLQDGGVSRHHADIYLEDQKIFIFVAPGKKALHINGQAVKAALVGADDVIKLGPYTIIIQPLCDTNSGEIEDDLRYQVVFEGKIKHGYTPDSVAKNLKKWLKYDDHQIGAFISGKPVVIKKNLSLQEAVQFKRVFEESGAKGQVQAITDSGREEPEETKVHPISPLHTMVDRKSGVKGPGSFSGFSQPISNESVLFPLSTVNNYEDDEEEDDEDVEAAFSLKDILNTYDRNEFIRKRAGNDSGQPLAVYKFFNNTVIDIRYLGSNESYFINTGNGDFRLARKNGSNTGYFYFSDDFKGSLRTVNSGSVAISDLLIDDNIFRRRKGIYHYPIGQSDEVIVNDGSHDYLIRSIIPGQSPDVPEPATEKALSWRHGVFSLIAHIIFLAVLSILPATQLKDEPKPETRFVQVDPEMIERLQDKPKPVAKPPVQKIKKLKPAPKKEKKAIKKPTPVKKKPAKVSKKPLKTAKRKTVSNSGKKSPKAAASKHPKAGGGFGKGNTSNRNVNQVGILSMLGDSKSASVQPAVADVTNLDAVKSANAGKAQFKVGGIKGKLGTSEIAVTGGDVVATKGNSQVLRSSGAGGEGTVAALEKGNVGQKKVMGMVEARLNKSVKIRGGMSREAVKRVIEQHLDEITFCYETALISNPSIKGKITVEWKIMMSGKVGEIRIKSSTIKSPEIYSCIKSAIKTWQFPKPQGNEVVVSYPFIFDIVGF